MRDLWRAVAVICLCQFAASSRAGARQPPPQPGQKPAQAPTMKRPDEIEVPPARARRSYDRARDATYVNIDVMLLARPAAAKIAEKGKGKDKAKDKDKSAAAPAPAFEGREVTLTFQLAYRGAHTYDLVAAYLIVESVAPPGAGDKLTDARQLVVGADPYEFIYERADYRVETVALAGAATASTPPVRRELAAFRVPTEDLPPIANAGRLAIKVGAEGFAVKSAQLTELRRTLTAGAG